MLDAEIARLTEGKRAQRDRLQTAVDVDDQRLKQLAQPAVPAAGGASASTSADLYERVQARLRALGRDQNRFALTMEEILDGAPEPDREPQQPAVPPGVHPGGHALYQRVQ